MGGVTAPDTISAPIEIQGDGGSASFTANAAAVGRPLIISGAVTGVSTGSNVTTLNLNGSNTSTSNAVSGIIGNGSGGGKVAVEKSGSGIWTLSGSQAFTGGLSITQGSLYATSDNLGANGGNVFLGSTDVNAAGPVELRMITSTFTNSHQFVVRSTDNALAIRTIKGQASLRNLVGGVQIGDGTGSINVLQLDGFLSLNGAISQSGTNAGSIVVTTGGGSDDVRMGGGTSNTYTGTTTVTAGTLIIAGSITSTSVVSGSGDLRLAGGTVAGVTVGSGGRLTGSGTTGAVVVNSSGTLAIGNSPGTMTSNGDLTLNSGSFSDFEINGLTSGLYDLAQGGQERRPQVLEAPST